jgi:predicted transcriptional regulator
MNKYPSEPGFKGDAETSREAAEAMQSKCGRLQQIAFCHIRAAGASGYTADELAEAMGMDRWTVQPRTSELKAKGLIVDSGQRRRNVTGKRAVVWTLPEYKQEQAA